MPPQKTRKAVLPRDGEVVGHIDSVHQGNEPVIAKGGKAVKHEMGHANTEETPTLVTPEMNLNSDHYQEVRSAHNLMMGNPVFEGIHTALPLSVEAGSHIEAFDTPKFMKAMGDCGEFITGANLFWLNLWWSATPGLPLNKGGIKQLKQKWFRTPVSTFPVQVTIAVTDEITPAETSCYGHLKLMSPEEPIHALILAIGDAIRTNACENDLAVWRKCILTCCVQFKKCKNASDIFIGSQNLREKIGTEFDVMHLSAIQRMFVIINFRNQRGPKLSAKELAKDYNKHIDTSEQSEPVSDTFIDTTLTVWKRVFSDAECRDLIMIAEENWRKSSPYSSLYKIEQYLRKAGNVESLRWLFQAMNDMIHAGLIEPTISLSQLTGKGIRGSNNKGVLDILLCKYECLAEFHGPILSSIGFRDEQRKLIIAETGSHKSIRKLFPHVNPDQTWTMAMDPEVAEIIKLIKAVVFDTQYDQPIKMGLKNSRAVADILSHESITDVVAEVRRIIEESRKPKDGDGDQPKAEDKEKSVHNDSMQDFINSWSIALGPTCTLGWNEQATPKEHLETMHTVCTNAMAHIKDDISKVEAAQDLASQLVEEGVRLIPEPRTTGELTAALRDSFLIQGVKGTLLVWYDSKQAGESQHQPLNNLVRFRSGHAKKLVSAVMQAKFPSDAGVDCDAIEDSLVFALLDGGRPLNEAVQLLLFNGYASAAHP